MRHILIVEDDIAFGTMLQTWLRRKGFEVDKATSVGAAVKLLVDMKSVDLCSPTSDCPITTASDCLLGCTSTASMRHSS